MYKSLLITILLVFLVGIMLAFSQSTPTDLVFNVQVQTGTNGQVQLQWQKLPGVTSYKVLRKSRSEKNFTTLATNLIEDNTFYTDASIGIGEAYEYCLQSASNPNISGYVYAGRELPAVHQQGIILLVIDNTYKTAAEEEIANYKRDLICDGWQVHTVFVDRSQSVQSVKQLILNEYYANTTAMKGVILLGHIPVPYSGKMAPDAHTDHFGAWPSDIYYADMNLASTIWNDAIVTATTALDPRNHNVVGDGKFDVSNKSTHANIKIFVSRIDVSNMPGISTDDVMLFKQYLAKNHEYRSGQKKFNNRGLIHDNFGYFSGEAFAQNGYRNFSSLVGAGNVNTGSYFNDLKTNSAIWSYACSPSSFTGMYGIGNTQDFASDKIQSVFTMLYGSYFGDWDNTNNFLRAPIASPSSTLVSVWGGRPNWFFHSMSLGEPIGYSYISSVDNVSYYPKGLYSGLVHQSMQGDPTLRMFVYKGPTNLYASSITTTDVELSWTASNENDIDGYYIYKAATEDEPFTLLTSNPIQNTTYIDTDAASNTDATVYMVRAVRLENTPTGSFYNVSPGVLSTKPPVNTPLPVTLLSFTGKILANTSNELTWTVRDEKSLKGYVIERSVDLLNFETIGFEEAKNVQDFNTYTHIDMDAPQTAYYRLKATDIDDKFQYSDVVKLERKVTDATVSVYPSPFSSYIQVGYASEASTMLNIQVIDMQGRIVKQSKFEVVAGNNTLLMSDLQELLSGMYVVKITDEENNSFMQKILKE